VGRNSMRKGYSFSRSPSFVSGLSSMIIQPWDIFSGRKKM
jgi:hypothetical protein